MISRNEFDAYNKAVEQIGNKAASDVESSVLNWCSQNPAASVAEKREAAKLIMEGYVQGYDDIASEFAAEWYDHRAKSEGISLDQAITMAVYSPEKSDTVARYQARKLAKGGDAAFAKACGEYARNDALRSLNETIIANVGRDRDKGARFARVPAGAETCTFCLMLASRGAVYHSRKTAGEFKHFHRNCDCKVVPGFEDNPDAELVEGIKPGEMRDQWWKFEKIDATEGLSSAERNKLKRLVLDGGELPEEVKKTNPTARMCKAGRAGSGWISAGYRLDAEVKANGFRDVSDFYGYLASRRTAAEIVEAGVLGEKILANADATPKFYELVKGHLNKSFKLAGGVSLKGLRERMALIEKQAGLSFADEKASRKLSEFLALHDRDWLLTGKLPEIGYADEATKSKKLKDKDHLAEARVANRLCAHGFRTVFVDDEIPVLNKETGRLQIVGLPDLDTGLEIKNVQSAKSENTISKHIGKAKRKQGYRQIVIDVSENPNISDEEARGMIASSLRRHSMPSALMVNHKGEVEAVYNQQK